MNYDLTPSIMFNIHSELKPLTTILKRLDIGRTLSNIDFLLALEENDIDDLWHASELETNKNYTGAYKTYHKATITYIIILCLTYNYYLKDNKNKKTSTIFNKLLLIGLSFYIKDNPLSEHYQIIVQQLKCLAIVEDDTIKNLLKEIEIAKHSTIAPISTKKNIRTVGKKYQIFISSTFLDLKEERQATVEAILKKGHIPAGMELFAANNKSQWEVIKTWIDDSDIYILLLGGRYGSTESTTGVSYIEKEYKYALKQNKPLFSLVLGDSIIDNKSLEIIKDYDLKNPKYIEFKSLVTSKLCSFPNSLDQIKIEINHSLDSIINDNSQNLVGWVKGNSI